MPDDVLLSDREREVWKTTREMTIDDAAEELGIAVSTVNTHLDRCYSKRKRARATLEWMERQEWD